MQRRFFAFILTSVLLASLGSLSSTTWAAPPDPCALLTQAQVSEVLGAAAGAGERLATSVCQWSTKAEAGAGSKKVTLTLQNAQAFAAAKTPVPTGTITKTPVSGIGDDAVYGTTKGAATVLTVKKGDAVFVVRVFGFPEDETKAKEKTLALDVLSKL